jgi:hypothetical protein
VNISVLLKQKELTLTIIELHYIMLNIIINTGNHETKIGGLSFELRNSSEALKFADDVLSYAPDGKTLEPSEWAAEAILLRVLRRVREGKVKPNQIKVTVDGTVLGVTDDGDFDQPFPGGFYNWRTDELF